MFKITKFADKQGAGVHMLNVSILTFNEKIVCWISVTQVKQLSLVYIKPTEVEFVDRII